MAQYRVTFAHHTVAKFSELFVREAHDLAARMSRVGQGTATEVHLIGAGNGSGIVGQYFKGMVAPEFKAHNRAAGLRTKVEGCKKG